jgi:hypothetical protein
MYAYDMSILNIGQDINELSRTTSESTGLAEQVHIERTYNRISHNFMGTLGISFCRCHSCCICLFLNVVLLCLILCSRSKCYIYLCVLISFVIFLVSFLMHLKVANFVFRGCWSMAAFCFCESGYVLVLFKLSYIRVTIDRIWIGK